MGILGRDMLNQLLVASSELLNLLLLNSVLQLQLPYSELQLGDFPVLLVLPLDSLVDLFVQNALDPGAVVYLLLGEHLGFLGLLVDAQVIFLRLWKLVDPGEFALQGR